MFKNGSILLLLAKVLVVLACLVIHDRGVRAHALCTNQWCCSPHGPTSSSTGCDFSNCSSDGSSWWSRDICCGWGTDAFVGLGCSMSDGTNYYSGSAIADPYHNVSPSGGHCQVQCCGC
jgi:hypothetical protein